MSFHLVSSAVIKPFVDGTFFAAAKTAYENRNFDSSKVTDPWASVFFLPIPRRVATLGADGRDQQDGILQIDLNYPTDSGTKDLQAKYEAIAVAYKAGTHIIYSGQEITISSCALSPGRIVNGFYRASISINFYAQIAR